MMESFVEIRDRFVEFLESINIKIEIVSFAKTLNKSFSQKNISRKRTYQL